MANYFWLSLVDALVGVTQTLFNLSSRGVQKTEESKKPPKPLPKFWFGFGAGFFHPETDKTNRFIYIYIYWLSGMLLVVWLANPV